MPMSSKYEFLLDLRVDKSNTWKENAGIYTLTPIHFK